MPPFLPASEMLYSVSFRLQTSFCERSPTAPASFRTRPEPMIAFLHALATCASSTWLNLHDGNSLG